MVGDLFGPPSWQGDVIAGRYELRSEIGAGGYALVARALHLELGSEVAVKVLHESVAADPNTRRRFELEARNASVLSHVNTIRVMDYGVDRGRPFLVMELLEGRSLRQVLDAEGRLEWPRALRVARQTAKSLWEAHEHERVIVHRDIKPQNIFVYDLPGEPDFVKVLDFGIARALTAAGADTQGALGTPKYMSPEQCRGETVTPKADLYALGCVLYEMLAGAPPFQPSPAIGPAAGAIELLRLHVEEAPPPLAGRVDDGVPTRLVALVDALMAKEPADRPASARALVSEFESLLTDTPAGFVRVRPPARRETLADDGAAAADEAAVDRPTRILAEAPPIASEANGATARPTVILNMDEGLGSDPASVIPPPATVQLAPDEPDGIPGHVWLAAAALVGVVLFLIARC